MRRVLARLLEPVSPRVLRVTTLMLMAWSLAGGCVRASSEYSAWTRERAARRWLAAVHVRQFEYYHTTRRFASSLETLGARPPGECRGRVFAFRAGRRAMFLAEVCTTHQCWLIDPSGVIRVRSRESGGGATGVHSFFRAQVTGRRSQWPVAGTNRMPAEGAAVFAFADNERAPTGQSLEPTRRNTLLAEEREDGVPLEESRGTVVVPLGAPEAFGLEPGSSLPPLSPTRDSPALWGTIEEVKR